MTNPAKCHCGSISWERNIEESRYICASCKRPLWQPIETAPRDKAEILVGGKLGKKKWVACAATKIGKHWLSNDGGDPEWSSIIAFKPTHWMPLPEGPGK